MLHHVEADAYVAATWEEYERIREEGVQAGMLAADPVFRVS
jgi:hypothetical protein